MLCGSEGQNVEQKQQEQKMELNYWADRANTCD